MVRANNVKPTLSSSFEPSNLFPVPCDCVDFYSGLISDFQWYQNSYRLFIHILLQNGNENQIDNTALMQRRKIFIDIGGGKIISIDITNSRDPPSEKVDIESN